MKFHLDENVTTAVGRGLRERGFDVSFTAQSELLGASDVSHFAFAAGEGRVLVSHDSDMLQLAADASATGVEFAGVAYCDKRKYSAGKLIERLLRLTQTTTADEMRNRVEYL